MTDRLKVFIVLLAAPLLLGLVAAAFWVQDWQYARPTPRPPGLVQPAVGVALSLAARLPSPSPADADKPLFLHFFSPSCPCSRFNLDHVRQLTRRYGTRVRFVAVVPARAPAGALPMPQVVDAGGAIARACGVYATPQAVLMDRRGRLYYRGNYNTGRYCDAEATEFARTAVDALLAGQSPPRQPPAATVAYGCPLPALQRHTAP